VYAFPLAETMLIFVPGLVIFPASDSIGVTVPGVAGLVAVLPPPNTSSPD
jgi:hypothetical protein